jgi:hypothetical protein
MPTCVSMTDKVKNLLIPLYEGGAGGLSPTLQRLISAFYTIGTNRLDRLWYNH